MINSVRPMPGSGDGITEYAYNMYLQLKRNNRVDLAYSIDRAKKNDALGLIRVNSGLSNKARAIGRGDYDIFHVVNQEVGFAAKDIKTANPDNRVVTTIHDVSRFERGLHRGALQSAYSALVKRSVGRAVENSDFLIFDSSQTMREVSKRFKVRRGAVVNIGIDGRFSDRIPGKRNETFTVGYIGSFAYHKNVSMIFKTARLMKDEEVEFRVYGVGAENRNLFDFARENDLKRLSMMGFAPEGRKVQTYDRFDVFVFPSLYEGFGLPILEAQARGLPVIIYKKGRIPEEIRRHCFEAEDEEGMERIIRDLKENGYGEKRRGDAIAYARSFTWERCAEGTVRIYKKLLGG
jgi:glycosyltransferase involved in cell wall biosynthesis